MLSRFNELKVADNSQIVRLYIINAENVLQVELYRQIFCKLLTEYKRLESSIIEKYNKFMDFTKYLSGESTDEENKKARKTKMLKDINPDQFISGYARICQKVRAPTIIAEYDGDNIPAQVKELPEDRVMVFPKNPLEGRQYYYTCDNSGFKFPGLRGNNLSNNEKYPVVPCCFANNPKKRKKSLWRQYYEDGADFKSISAEGRGVSREEEQHIISTDKLLNIGRVGKLPLDVEKLFTTIDSTGEYYREGTMRSVNSVISVLCTALGNTIDELIVRDTIYKLIERGETNVSEEINRDSALKYLSVAEKYFDPRLFIHALGFYFKCNIFLFARNAQFPFGSLVCPNHQKIYLASFNSNFPTVIVYEHYGSEAENLKYPQCELVKCVKNKLEYKKFDSKTEVIKRLQYVFQEMYGGEGSDNQYKIPKLKSKIIGIANDYYGKTRYLRVEWTVNRVKKSVCVLLLAPIESLDYPQDCNYQDVSDETAKSFLKYEGIEYIPVVVSKYLIGYKTNAYYIPVVPVRQNKEDTVVVAPTGTSSILTEYTQMRRQAIILEEYTLYLFSRYWNSNGLPEITDDLLVEFTRKYLEVDPKFKYGTVSRAFSTTSGVMRAGKLIVPSRLIIKKLLYVLQINLKNNTLTRSYQNLIYIPRFYTDVRDFTSRYNETVIYGRENLLKQFSNFHNNYKLYDSVNPQSNLEEELLHISNRDQLIVVVFTAKWSKTSVSIENRIFDVLGKFKKYKDMSEQHPTVKFVYIDSDTHRELMTSYKLISPPSILVFRRIGNAVNLRTTITGEDDAFELGKRLQNVLKTE
jgi:hypothetical protein